MNFCFFKLCFIYIVLCMNRPVIRKINSLTAILTESKFTFHVMERKLCAALWANKGTH
jgi:hypothetical protein